MIKLHLLLLNGKDTLIITARSVTSIILIVSQQQTRLTKLTTISNSRISTEKIHSKLTKRVDTTKLCFLYFPIFAVKLECLLHMEKCISYKTTKLISKKWKNSPSQKKIGRINSELKLELVG